MIYLYDYCSPLGKISLASDGDALCGLWFEDQKYFQSNLVKRVLGDGIDENDAEAQRIIVDNVSDISGIERAAAWLDAYFNGERMDETCKINLHGSPFQELVWDELTKIGYGQMTTYGDIAKSLEKRCGRPMSARAVGSAVGKNPISIIVPCHRVVGASGSLTGYAGGLERKRYLLELEGAI